MEDTSPERVQITYKTPKITFLDQVDLVWKKSHQKILNFSKVVVLTPSRDFPAGFFNIVRGFKNNCYIRIYTSNLYMHFSGEKICICTLDFVCF